MMLKFNMLYVFSFIILINFKYLLSFECEFFSGYICEVSSVNSNTEGDFSNDYYDNDIKNVVINGKYMKKFELIKQEFPVCKKFTNLEKFDISEIEFLDENFFNDCINLNTIWINNTNIQRISNDLFAEQSKLSFLSLFGNNLTTLPEDVFKNQKNLERLSFEQNKIENLPSNIFKSQKNLLRLHLNANKIQVLDSNWFKSLENLKTLNLNDNNIFYLPEGVFEPLINLRALFLRSNKINSIHSTSFGIHNNLTLVDLRNNFIYEIDEKFIDKMTVIKLHLEGNLCFWQNINPSQQKDLLTECFENYTKTNPISRSTVPIFDPMIGLNIKVYPDSQKVIESFEVVFYCRDESSHRASIQWSRKNNQPFPSGTRIHNERLEMYDIQKGHAGEYICTAVGFPEDFPGNSASVSLEVDEFKFMEVKVFEDKIKNILEQSKEHENICRNISAIVASRIINGDEIEHGRYPWHVALMTMNNGYFCGGTLVTKKHIITAAHCINDSGYEMMKKEQIKVLLGARNISLPKESGRITSNVYKIRIHPDWNPNRDNLKYDADIAVLELEHEVKTSDLIRPICVMKPLLLPAFETKGIVVGYGKSEDETKVHEDVVKMIEVPIHKNEDCFLADNNLVSLSSKRTFCAGYGKGSGVCKGDSGSGLVVIYNGVYYLRGIVSAGLLSGTYGCNVNTYSIFTDVTKFYYWISDEKFNDAVENSNENFFEMLSVLYRKSL